MNLGNLGVVFNTPWAVNRHDGRANRAATIVSYDHAVSTTRVVWDMELGEDAATVDELCDGDGRGVSDSGELGG